MPPYTRDTIKELALRIAIFEFMNSGKIDNGMAEAGIQSKGGKGKMIPQDAFSRIQGWLRVQTSALLCVEGVPRPHSDLSPIALQVQFMMAAAQIPNVSFFTKRRYSNYDLNYYPGLSQSQAGLVTLLYSIVYQLIEVLPPDVVTDHDFESTISKLSGSMESLDAAVEIIRVLLAAAPASLTIILDCIESFDWKGARPYLRKVIHMLREQGLKKVIKVLLTTHGFPRHLVKDNVFKVRERVHVNASPSDPEDPESGGCHINQLTMPRGRYTNNSF
ncbi:hypothetical protein GE09DRAFT_1049375 [Coniochaeta sp. 2T2.1]|nr:hypothetical protein GE09DRAFT_1049375 [Coniochaeta sp. 2T2.1]